LFLEKGFEHAFYSELLRRGLDRHNNIHAIIQTKFDNFIKKFETASQGIHQGGIAEELQEEQTIRMKNSFLTTNQLPVQLYLCSASGT
jgi:hypothetical protein